MTQNLLQQYFPMLPTRIDVETRIQKDPVLYAIFREWPPISSRSFLISAPVSVV